MPRRVAMVAKYPPVGLGIVTLIVGLTGGHWSVLALFYSSWYVGWVTGSRTLRKPRMYEGDRGRITFPSGMSDDQAERWVRAWRTGGRSMDIEPPDTAQPCDL